LAKPDLLARDPRRHGRLGPRRQKGDDLGHDVVIARVVLHRLGRALHMHQHHLAAQFGGGRQAVGRMVQGRDVVPHRRPGDDGGAGDGGLHGVDADPAVPARANLGDQGRDAGDLFGFIDRIRTGARAFSAHVQHVGALFDQLQGVNQGRLGRGVPPAVGKAVRRDVDDAHDERRLHEGLMGHATSTPEAAV